MPSYAISLNQEITIVLSDSPCEKVKIRNEANKEELELDLVSNNEILELIRNL